MTAVLMVSAFAAQTRMTLANLPVVGGNERDAVLYLIDMISLKGATVTADALHAHDEMALAILDKQGHYALRLKENQPILHEAASLTLQQMMVSAFAAQTRMTLANLPVVGGNERDAVLYLIDMISLKGATVTADALHAHDEMALAILDKQGHYALRLKENQPILHEAASLTLQQTFVRFIKRTKDAVTL
ncbi:ISAs1 family transposase [Allorhizobium terrae]|nr:ISAs1 family transposase [Allorhizobium terrae]